MLVYRPRDSVAGVRAAAGPVRVPVRRTGAGTLVVAAEPVVEGPAADALEDVLDAAAGRVVCDVLNVPGEPDFDAPAAATAHLLVDLLAGRPGADVTVASFDWYALGAARAAGLRTAFVTPPEIALGASVAYVTAEGHAECHAHWAAVLADPASVEAARGAGVAVVAWGAPAGSLEELRAAGAGGVVLDDD